jgi:hypothetical protein
VPFFDGFESNANAKVGFRQDRAGEQDLAKLCADQRGRAKGANFEPKSHGQRQRMSAAGNQLAKEPVLRRYIVDVHRFWVELLRKANGGLLRQLCRPAGAALSDSQCLMFIALLPKMMSTDHLSFEVVARFTSRWR